MKKIIIVLFFSVLIFLTPISSSIKTEYNDYGEQEIKAFMSLKIKINDEFLNQIYQIVENIDNSFYRYKARLIINKILNEDGELNVNIFFNILNNEGIKDYNNIKTTYDVLDDLYNFIFGLIVERLGWVNDLSIKTSNIISDARNLWDDRTLPKEIKNEIENIIVKFNALKNLTNLLVEGKYLLFFRNWSPFIFIDNITSIIESIQLIINDAQNLFRDIQIFIYDVSDFISWFSSEPWKDQIYVYGRVVEGINGVSNVTIGCMNITTQTDEYGNFSMYIPANPSESSIPSNEYYGIHKCIITAKKNNISKMSIDVLSYVFSGGSIFWMFIITDEESESLNCNFYFDKIFENYPNIPFLINLLLN